MQDGLYLILLDNLESVMAEDGTIEEGLRLFVERCLTQPSGVRLIVTSREQVKIAAAALPTTRSIPLREGLPEDEAVALLRDLDPQGALGLRDAPEDDLRRAARFTRGIPRALEILAGILHEDPTASLSRLLADENLFGEQVVEQLVAAGYNRLGETERRMIEALAVFDRPVEETSVAYLLHPWWPGLDVRARLHRLVRGYFVSVNRVTGRYSLHPLDRDYAYRQIPDAAEKELGSYNRRNLELRAADFYASIRKPESEWQAIDDVAPQLAEFEHRVSAGDYDGAYRVLDKGDSYLSLWGHYSRLVEMREKLQGQLTESGLQAANLDRLSSVYLRLGQIEQTIKLCEKGLTIARKIGGRWCKGVMLGRLGNSYRALGQVERAIKLQEEARTIAHKVGERQYEGMWVGFLGKAYRATGQAERAIKFYEEALTIAREIGDRRYEVVWLNNLGNTYHALGQVERAVKLYEQALPIAREIGYRLGQSYQLLGLGQALLAAGSFTEARRRCVEALALDVLETSYLAALALGIVLLHQRDEAVGETFADAAARCQALLDKTAGLYEPRYVLAAALVGSVVCDPRWAKESERAGLLAPALAEYQRVLEITSAPGIVQDALRDLELIRAAGIEGLEPVFELLESAGGVRDV